jgi:hypothetical protein
VASDMEFVEQVEHIGELLQGVRGALTGMLNALTLMNEAVDDLLAMIEEPEPAELQVTVKESKPGSALVQWTTTLQPPTWLVGRDGRDTSENGAWSTTLPGTARSWEFNRLKPGTAYTFTVSGKLGDATVSRTATLTTSQPTTPPVPGTGTTAAEKYGWGQPHPISDTFDGYEGRPDPNKWIIPGPDGWDGHIGNGRRMPGNVFVKGGMMVLRGDSNGDTGWVRQKMETKYGRWQVRSRSRNTGSSGGLYHVLHLLWPTQEGWPVYGETDFVEYGNPDAKAAEAWLHYPHNKGIDVQQIHIEKPGVDMTQWHVFELEWTKDHLRGWIDGEEWYTVSGGANAVRRDIQGMYPAGSYTAQLDNFTGDGGLRPAVFEIDRVLFWPV